jgi:hypothetical protein
VCASFGRGFFVFDDIAPLREVTEEKLKEEASLYPVRDAWIFPKRMGAGSQGAAQWTCENPAYGAVITYHLAEGLKTKQSARKKEEAKLKKEKEPLEFPEWEVLKEERLEEKPKIWLTIRDSEDNVIRKLTGPTGKGFHRVSWDMRTLGSAPIDIHEDQRWTPLGPLVLPGKYTVSIAAEKEGKITQLAGPIEFEVIKYFESTIQPQDQETIDRFREDLYALRDDMNIAEIFFKDAEKKVKAMEKALGQMETPPGVLYEELYAIKRQMAEFKEKVFGDPAKREMSVYDHPSVNTRLWTSWGGLNNLTYGPTGDQIMNLEIAEKEFEPLKAELKVMVDETIPAYEQKLIDAGAPWMSGQPME